MKVGDTISVGMEGNEIPCKVVSILSHGSDPSDTSARLEFKLPFIECVFWLMIDGHGRVIKQPQPRHAIDWYRVTGNHEAEGEVDEVFLSRDAALSRAMECESCRLLTFRDSALVKSEHPGQPIDYSILGSKVPVDVPGIGPIDADVSSTFHDDAGREYPSIAAFKLPFMDTWFEIELDASGKIDGPITAAGLNWFRARAECGGEVRFEFLTEDDAKRWASHPRHRDARVEFFTDDELQHVESLQSDGTWLTTFDQPEPTEV